MSTEKRFTPALGTNRLTPIYDVVVAMFTREGVWRQRLVERIQPRIDDRIIDVGCGTGSLAILLKREVPGANIIGIDPDLRVLKRAQQKAGAAGVEIDWRTGFLTAGLVGDIGTVTKVVSSLVFHQTPLAEKQHILNCAYALLESGGELHIADYGLQRSRVMQFLFRQTVQRLDGVEDTQPNANGVLPELISKAGFVDISETAAIPTLTGSISTYLARRP